MKTPLLVFAACLAAAPLVAEELPRFPVTRPLTLWNQAYGPKPADKVYLYRDEKNPVIQGVNFLFRAQFQAGAISANQGAWPGSHNSTTEWRRFTLGGGIQFLQNFHFTNVWNIGGLDTMGYQANDMWYDHGQTRGSMSEIYIDYIHKGRPSVRVGKQFPHFLAENRHIGSDYNLPELPQLEAQLSTGAVYGVKVSDDSPDKIPGWGLAIWSNTDERSRNTWPTCQSAGTLVNGSVRVNDTLMKKGRISLDWVYNTQDMNKMATAHFRDNYIGNRAKHTLALYYVGSQGPADLVLEGIWAHDLASYRKDGRIIQPSNVYGVMAMPMYMLTEHIQAVGRAEWSKGNNAVRLNPRYSNLARTNGLSVDEYYAFAIGLNFFPYPDKHNRLKIMTMVEYSNSNRKRDTGGFTGWTFIGGVYTNF